MENQVSFAELDAEYSKIFKIKMKITSRALKIHLEPQR
jgi:hypothetical protein